MSASKRDIMIVDVTKGDCLESNRKNGKSNTGTYFISSLKNFTDFEKFFSENIKYKIEVAKTLEYCCFFNTYFLKYKDEYVGKMFEFSHFANVFSLLTYCPEVNIDLRVNDNRVFMKFKNNEGKLESSFRNLLYEDLSLICFERIDDIVYVYPVINNKKFYEENSVTVLVED